MYRYAYVAQAGKQASREDKICRIRRSRVDGGWCVGG